MTEPVTAAEAVEDYSVTVTFKNETFTLPSEMDDADADVLIYIEEERPSLALRALLGDEQFAKYRALKPKVKDHGDFIEKCFEALGSDTGK